MECLLQKNSVNYYLSKCRPHPVILWPQPRKLVQPLPAKVIILGVHEAIGAPWIMTRAPLVSGGDVWARDPATQPLFISSVDTHDLLSAIINQDFFFSSSSFATVWPLSFMLSWLLLRISPPLLLQPPTVVYVYIILLLRDIWLQCLMINFSNWRENHDSNDYWEIRMCRQYYWWHFN